MSFGPGDPTAVFVWPGDAVVTGWTWRGECLPYEDEWVPIDQ